MRATRATLCIVGPLVIGIAFGRADLGVLATTGGFAGFHAVDEPYRWRSGLVAGMGVALAVAMVAGTLAEPSPVAAALVPAVLAALGAFGCLAIELPPPREYFLVLACLLGTGLPASASAFERGGLVLAGAAFAWVLAMSPALWPRRPRPEERAVDQAYDRVAALIASVGRGDSDVAQHEAVVAVRTAHVAVRRSGPGGGLRFEAVRRRAVAIEGLLEAGLSLAIEGVAVDPALAESVRSGGPIPPGDDAMPGPELRLRRALQIAHDTELTLPPAPRRHRSARDVLGDAAGAHSLAPAAAVRIGLGVGIGVGVGRAIGVDHAYWVGLTAAAVLQATNASAALSRAVNRALGTAVGVGLAAAVLAPDPAVGVVVVAIALFQFVAESIIVASYGVAVVLITPIPLLLLDTAGGGTRGRLTAGREVDGHGDRLRDRAGGRAVRAAAGVARAAAGRAGERDRRDPAVAAATLAAGDLRHPSVRRPRRDLRTALLNMRAVQRDATGDLLRREPGADSRWPATVSIQRLAYLVLSLPRPALAAADRVAPPLDRELGSLEALAAGEDAPPPVGAVPALPRTSAELAALRGADGG